MKQKNETRKKIVVKFGGSSLSDHERLLRAVKAVARESKKGSQIAVVVSAMGKTTDLLLNTAKNTSNGKLEKQELDEILSMGERTSVRIFAAALRTNGVESRYFDPSDNDWPIITDTAFSNANPLLGQCMEIVREKVLPIVEKGVVPVIAGFIGRTVDGKTTTLGRGGSDTTAFILAEALQADEVILVTDADGIMSGDPKLVSDPVRLSEIDINTLVGLADAGAKFIHSKALKYKPGKIHVRVINHLYGDLDCEGTVISGELSTELDVDIAYDAPIAELTIIGVNVSENPRVVLKIIERAKLSSSLLGMSMNGNSMILYVSEEKDIDRLINDTHRIVLDNLESRILAVKKGLAFLKIKGVGLEGTHGIIGKISEVLRSNEVNIFGIFTITSSILLFVSWDEREKALNLIKRSLRRT